MEKVKVEFQKGFNVIAGNSKSQCAVMVLEKGSSTGGPDNKHSKSDQWLYVISGKGKAIVNDTETEIGAGVLLHIESGETHEIKNIGEDELKTINFYVPPAY